MTQAPPAATDDAVLLRAYVRTQSRAALNDLIARHLDFVHRSALRQTRDQHLAEDVTQTVFIILAARAGTIRSPGHLPGWLFKVTRFAGANAIKLRNRRTYHERASARGEAVVPHNESTDENSTAMNCMDEAIASLKRNDRDVVVLRYLKDRSIPQISTALGISEAAVYKRSQRALLRMRKFFASRGIAASSEMETAMQSAARAGAARPDLLANVVTTAVAANAGHAPAAWATAKGVLKIMAKAELKRTAVTSAFIVLGLLIVGVVGYEWFKNDTPQATAIAPATTLPAPAKPQAAPQRLPVLVNDPALAGLPYAAGWPIAMPGEICGTPAVADIEGNGKPCVIVASAHFGTSGPLAHPHPDRSTLVYALRADGTCVPGWPVAIANDSESVKWRWWASSPSIFKVNGRDHVAINSSAFRFHLIRPDGTIIQHPVVRTESTSAVTIADLGDGKPTLFPGMDPIAYGVSGQRLANWSATYTPPEGLRHGYSPCIGDAAGDGQMKLFYATHNGKDVDHVYVLGLDKSGKLLNGWPQRVPENHLFSPVLGDVTGGPELEVIFTGGRYIFAWTHDGKPLPCDNEDDIYSGVFKSDVYSASCTPALADLDGDGKAEIIIYDQKSNSIRAWRGDGSGINAPPGGNADDSLIAELPTNNACGVSVAFLGDEPGAADFFAGTFWVHRTRDGKVTVTDMVPNDSADARWNQPTVCDLLGDGKAEVIVGRADGRLFVYKTGLSFHPERAQWPTALGSFQRTGVLNRSKPQ